MFWQTSFPLIVFNRTEMLEANVIRTEVLEDIFVLQCLEVWTYIRACKYKVLNPVTYFLKQPYFSLSLLFY